MIYDELKNAEKYRGILPHLDRAIDFLNTLDDLELSSGRNEIGGDNVYAMMSDYFTIDGGEAKYETHEKYIDIQLVLKGSEYIRCAPPKPPVLTKKYDADRDVEFYAIAPGTDLLLEPGKFAVFMTGEIHAPKITCEESRDVIKIVVKVKA